MKLSTGTLRKLENLSFAPRMVRQGVLKGDRRSLKRGASLEFADYRAYTPGDDLRRVDWNVYARSDKPFLKLFEEEEDLTVHILLDISASMDWGEAEENKIAYSSAVTAGLALIALAGGDRCSITAIVGDRQPNRFGPARNRFSFAQVPPFLQSLVAGGPTHLARSFQRFTQEVRAPGIAVVVSDLFSPEGYAPGLKHLGLNGHEILLIHVLHPEEITPQISGDLKLVDAENGRTQEISLTSTLRKQYQNRVQSWRNELYRFCLARRIHYFPVTTSESPDRFLLYELRRRGLVR